MDNDDASGSFLDHGNSFDQLYLDPDKEDDLIRRNAIVKMLNDGRKPNSRDLSFLMKYESDHRICRRCKIKVSDPDAVFFVADMDLKGKSVDVGYHYECFKCETLSLF